MGSKVYVGIDLGTTNTLVSYIKKESPAIIKFDGSDVLPSVLYYDAEQDSFDVGKTAYKKGSIDPDNRVMSAKTFMGTEKKYCFDKADGEKIVLTPTDVAAEVLKTAKEKIIKKLKLSEDDEIYAVVTVPAAFSFVQREETKTAVKKSGIRLLGLINEPVAAAVACVEDLSADSDVFVVDIGGGTYDTAVIHIDENERPSVFDSEGDRRLGGDDINNVVFEYIKSEVEEDYGISLSDLDSSGLAYSDYYRLISALLDRAKEAKEALTQDDEYEIVYNEICEMSGYNTGEYEPFRRVLKKEKFDKICSGIYKSIEDRLEKSIKSLERKGRKLSDINHLVLVGGTCYIPAIIDLIEKKVGIKAIMSGDKTKAVAQGAAIIADSWTVVGGELGGVISQSLGVKVKGEKFSPIIEKGTNYPCKRSHIYETVYDNQTTADIAIYAAAPDKENITDINQHEYYGYITLDNIEKAPKGQKKIEVEFSFDNDQVLTVTAKDIDTNNTKTLIANRQAYKESGSGRAFSIDLLIDVSGSMRGQAMNDAKNACRKMITEIIDLNVSEMGITAFNDNAIEICGITQNSELLLSKIDSMSAKNGTAMASGISHSTQKLVKNAKDEKIIFLMTDGAPNNGDKSETLAKTIRDDDVRLAVIYIGRQNARGFAIAQNVAAANTQDNEKPLFYTSEDMSELGAIFKRVYADIAFSE